jgi:sec-independent protein translocase protein TatA
MGSLSLVHWLILGGVGVILLGGGRFSSLAGDMAKGIKQFKKGMAEDDETPASRIEAKRADPVVDPATDRVRDTER